MTTLMELAIGLVVGGTISSAAAGMLLGTAASVDVDASTARGRVEEQVSEI